MKTSLIAKIVLVILLVPGIVIGSLLAIQILLKPPGTFKSELSVSDDPVLGRPIKLTLTLDYSPKCGKKPSNPYEEDIYQNRYFTAYVNLPEAFELIDGDLEWQGYLHCGEAPKKIEATIRAVQIGEYKIRAEVDPGMGEIFHHDFRYLEPELFVDVFSDRAFVSTDRIELGGDEPFNSYGPQHDYPVALHLSLSDKPSLNKDLELKCTVVAMRNVPTTQVALYFPDGFVIVKDNTKVSKGVVRFNDIETSLTWTGDMVQGDIIELEAAVKPVKTGRWNIITDARYLGTIMNIDALVVYMFQDGSDIISNPITDPYYSVGQPKIFTPDYEIGQPPIYTSHYPNYPKVNDIVEVQCTFTPNGNDIPKAQVRLIPNERYFIIQRDFCLDSDLKADVLVKASAQIKVIRSGECNLQAYIENYRTLSKRYVFINKASVPLYIQP